MRPALCLLALVAIASCVEVDPALETEAVESSILDVVIPATANERPPRVLVLPVVWVPPESTSLVGTTDWTRATTNLLAHLRVAQEKYRQMLRDNGRNLDRGTFSLATWNATAEALQWWVEDTNTLAPFVVYSSTPYMSLPPEGAGRDETIAGQVATAAGCKAASCPFVFVIVVADTTGVDEDFAATNFNYGHNGSGGYIRVPFDTVRASNGNTSIFQSSLLHELGHAFGLFHLNDGYKREDLTHLPPTPCADWQSCPVDAYAPYCNAMPWNRERLEFHCSPSVMSYSKLNRSAGCVAKDANGYCAMGTPTDIFLNVPGILIAENVYGLARNQLVFPTLAADFDFLVEDDDGDYDGKLLWHTSFGNPDDPSKYIPGHPRMKASSPHTATDNEARASFGYFSKSIAPAFAGLDARTHWRSIPLGEDGWAHIDFDFPQGVTLARVRVFTGYLNGNESATDLEVQKGDIGGPLVSCGSASLGLRVDGEATVLSFGSCAGAKRRYRVRVKADVAQRVVLRGVRFFDTNGDELQAPREPIAKSTQGHMTFQSPVQTVVGSNQWIEPYSAAWQPARMWHSRDVGTDWVWIDVRLPDLVNLYKLVTHTGHSGQYHAANQIRIEGRNAQGDYVLLKQTSLGAPSSITTLAAPIQVTHLRIGFKSPSGYVVVRGIRFIAGPGEVYAPRRDPTGIYPLM